MTEENKTKINQTEEEEIVETPVKKEERKLVKEKPKKTEAVINVSNIPMSTKHSMALCDFIRNRKIVDAVKDIEQVLKMKKAVPMKGEIPHRKGKGIMSGRFPQNASENFLKLLQSLIANANYNGIEDPI